MAEVIANQIDKLCNVEFHTANSESRGAIDAIYHAARSKQGGPLSYLAAKGLIDHLKPRDTVFIITGTGIDLWVPEGETDGPIGCAALARALTKAFGVKVVVICEKEMLPGTEAAIFAAGEFIYNHEMFNRMSGNAVTTEAFPLGKEPGKKAAKELAEKYKPSAMIFIERIGPNEEGIYHFLTGSVSSPEEMSYGHYLLEEAQRLNAFTIGIGDGGNEIGFGKIHDELKKVTSYASTCKCPCKKGIATVAETDVLVAASISNWGVYGIIAMLAYLLNDLDILHDAQTEYRMIEACVMNGCIDGLYTKPYLSVDGVGVEGNQAIITLLRQIVKNGLLHFERTF